MNSKINDEFLKELQEIINSSAVKTVQQIFGYEIHSDSEKLGDGAIVIAHVTFLDDFETINFCFVFDLTFVRTLISQLYPLDKFGEVETKEACEDTASELANIISNKIKYFMNSNGFQSIMELPTAETIKGGLSALDAENIVRVNFTSPQVETRKNALSVGMVA